MPRPCFISLLAGASLVGCFPPDEGRPPPLDRFYFPVGIALAADGQHLYVANSDFDLQFNAGTLQVLDAGAIRERALRCVGDPGPDCCAELGVNSADDRLAAPGQCGPWGLADSGALRQAVEIGAFATDALYVPCDDSDVCGGEDRVFVPVRGDASLHYASVRGGGLLDCGQGQGEGGACDDAHRRGDDPAEENTRNQRLPSEPFAIAAAHDGSALLLTHQTEGAVSMFRNETGGPTFKFTATGMPFAATGIAALRPRANLAVDDSSGPVDDPWNAARFRDPPAFLVSFRNSSELRIIRAISEADTIEAASHTNPKRPFLEVTGSVRVTAAAQTFDSRGIQVDTAARDACELECCGGDPACEASDADVLTCLSGCDALPSDVYLANRSPGALLIGTTLVGTTDSASVHFSDNQPVRGSPSRVVVGDVMTDAGLARRVFIVSFDAAQIHIYDPARRRVEHIVRTGRGPHALAIDNCAPPECAEPRALAYVGHFTDSYIGVIDLDQRNGTFGELVLTLGKPTPPRASK